MPKLPMHVSIREAKNRLSELVRKAAQGTEIVITSHGQPRARLVQAESSPRPFRVDWEWLRKMKVSNKQTPSEVLVRRDRDGRG